MPIVSERFVSCCLTVLLLTGAETDARAFGDEAATAPAAVAAVQKTPADQDLLSGSLKDRWTHFSSKDEVALNEVWSIIEADGQRLLQCLGNPRGFLLTRQTYENFELTFEWKYVDDADGNSGILIFTKNEPRLWPTSMQIQLHQPRTGAVFPTGDAKSDNSTEPPPNGLAKEVGQWNVCKIVSTDGRVKVTINDRSVGEVTGCQPASGHIAIQCEGSRTLFRNIRIRELPSETGAEATAGPADSLTTPKPATKPENGETPESSVPTASASSET